MGAITGPPIYLNEHIKGLLQLMRIVIMNANGKTVEEISEATGIKPEYIEDVLRLAYGMRMVEEKDSKFYINEEVRDSYVSVLSDVVELIPRTGDPVKVF
jgi:hypothetical protein